MVMTAMTVAHIAGVVMRVTGSCVAGLIMVVAVVLVMTACMTGRWIVVVTGRLVTARPTQQLATCHTIRPKKIVL